MKFDTASKVWECAGKDKSRPALTHVNLAIKETDEGRKGWLEATDSYVLVRVPVELDDMDTAGAITVDALKAAAKLDGQLACNGTCTDLTGRSYPRPEDGQFPDCERLVPAESRGEHDGICEFGVAPELLVRALKALGGKRGVRVIVGSPLRPLRIVAMGGVPGAECIVMPIRLAV